MEETTSREMISYIHCKECVSELAEKGYSPQEYMNIEIGLNIDNQLLLACVRHNKEVATFALKEDYVTQFVDRGCDCHEDVKEYNEHDK